MKKVLAILFVVILVVVAALFLMKSESGNDFGNSPLGSKGLAQWLPTRGIPVLSSNSHVTVPARGAASLRILPLFYAIAIRGMIQTETGDSVDETTLQDKVTEIPTLIVLPKWKLPVAKQGIAKPDLLAPDQAIDYTLSMLPSEGNIELRKAIERARKARAQARQNKSDQSKDGKPEQSDKDAKDAKAAKDAPTPTDTPTKKDTPARTQNTPAQSQNTHPQTSPQAKNSSAQDDQDEQDDQDDEDDQDDPDDADSDLRLLPRKTNVEIASALLDAKPSGQTVSLRYAQLFDRKTLPDDCKERFGIEAGALLLSCGKKTPFFVLSDPDLLNNHGLAQAGNAAFAAMLVATLRGAGKTQPVYLDGDSRVLTKHDDDDDDDDEGDFEFSRIFEYPLSAIWASLLLLTAICFWRGAYRIGPVVNDANDRVEISKTAAVQAMARLLRLSGNDGRLASQFVQNHLTDAALRVFGPSVDSHVGVKRLFERLARRGPESQALQQVAQALIERGPDMSQTELHHHLETFRDLSGRADLEAR